MSIKETLPSVETYRLRVMRNDAETLCDFFDVFDLVGNF